MTPDERAAGMLLIALVTDCIATAPDGMPSGVLYGLLNARTGLRLQTYQSLIDGLETAGYITTTNHVLRPTAKLCPSQN